MIVGQFPKVNEAEIKFRIGQWVYCPESDQHFQVTTIYADDEDAENVRGDEDGHYLYFNGHWASIERRGLVRSRRTHFF